MVGLQRVSLSKQTSFRLVNSKFPPISLFDDVMDAADFETAYALQALTNPRILNELGDLTLLPTKEIPFGISGVNYVTAPFTHVNPDGSRFSDGTFGMLYLADTTKTAIAETKYHQQKYFCNIEGLHYDTVDMRCLKVTFSAELVNAVAMDDIHASSDNVSSEYVSSEYVFSEYAASRIFGGNLKKSGEAGLQYPSVRNEGAICWGLMSPIYAESAVQTQHFEFVFDGKSISKVRELAMDN